MNNIPSEITNTQDQIDSRDVQERIYYLAGIMPPTGMRTEEEQKELDTLLALKVEYIDYFSEDSWNFGAQFILDSYFEDYAQELAEDIGAISSNLNWPNSYINWGRAAEALKMDYTEIDFDGVAYQTQEA